MSRTEHVEPAAAVRGVVAAPSVAGAHVLAGPENTNRHDGSRWRAVKYDPARILVIGPSGVGKTTFARRLKRTLRWVRRRKGRSLRLVLERLGWVARIADRGRQWRDRVHRMQMRYPHLAAFEFQSPGVAAAFLQSLSAAASPGLDADVDGPASSG